MQELIIKKSNWELSETYRFDLQNKTVQELTMEERVQLLLYPPPSLPLQVTDYLHGEARIYSLQQELQLLKQLQKRMFGLKRSRSSISNILLNGNQNSRPLGNKTRKQKKYLPMKNIKQHLYKVLPSLGVDLAIAKAAHEYIKNKHQWKETGIIKRNRQQETKDNNEKSDEGIIRALSLLEPEDQNEYEIIQEMEKEKNCDCMEMDSQNNNTDKRRNNRTVSRSLVDRRFMKRTGELDECLQKIKIIEPAVRAWLEQKLDQTLLLSDGELCVSEKVMKKTITRQTCTQALCEYFLSIGCDQTLELTRAVMQALK